MTRNRFVAILLMPVVVISFVPLLVAAVAPLASGWVALFSAFNAFCAGAFVSLTVEPGGGMAELTFLARNLQAGRRLTNGIVSGNTIRFYYATTDPARPTLPAHG